MYSRGMLRWLVVAMAACGGTTNGAVREREATFLADLTNKLAAAADLVTKAPPADVGASCERPPTIEGRKPDVQFAYASTLTGGPRGQYLPAFGRPVIEELHAWLETAANFPDAKLHQADRELWDHYLKQLEYLVVGRPRGELAKGMTWDLYLVELRVPRIACAFAVAIPPISGGENVHYDVVKRGGPGERDKTVGKVIRNDLSDKVHDTTYDKISDELGRRKL
jgi:hypothetical protein